MINNTLFPQREEKGEKCDATVKARPGKSYEPPELFSIGLTTDLVQGYYTPNPNDAYPNYYVYRTITARADSDK